MWPFGKNNDKDDDAAQPQQAPAADQVQDNPAPADAPDAGAAAPQAESGALGAEGPFDIDIDKPENHDFSDFAKASVNLGSLLLPIPKNGDIQVEMGPNGPTMLHLVTQYGRLTPVAFAAPTSGGLWADSAEDIEKGLSGDGLTVTREQGPWGDEVVGKRDGVCMRIIGVEGPRWMLRVTCGGPEEGNEDLAAIARETLARIFVNRGDNPIPAGQPLPVTLPAQMAQQIHEAYKQQQEAEAAKADEENKPAQQ
ncbi:DUF3710 domain-containing protein [Corynebacterium sp. TAE3-ERU12]|uniref:DUF3710 domain-containing protein n=1 Tax=Corynebacterium sp. TAE3-ERU12 TaxID=2849491 RepID=UPI001C48494B|nr:DUF3710 domain-containing protein [Corynebacterium sp. TAE3-ERU12]MBV7295328.1 DUF3710 domain-containing protein [Corynebacterium sp. TAE3-ERU12]